MDSLDDLLYKINNLPRRYQTLFIAIDGRGGSGKSKLAKILKQRLSNVSIISIDDYNQSLGKQIFREQIIIPLKEGKSVRYQRFDWDTQQLAEWYEISPGGIVIIEGVNSLDNVWQKDYDFRIWIECPAEVGFKRGLRRDIKIYKKDTTYDWINKWLPKEKLYIELQKPQEKADSIIDGTKEFE